MNGSDVRVAVTGLGVLAPNGHGLEQFAEALRKGRSGITFHEQLAELKFGCQVGGIPDGVEELQSAYLSEEELFAMNANMVYAAIASIDAWKDAGLEMRGDGDEPDWDTGGIIGTGIGGIDTIAETLAPKTQAGRVRRLGSTMVEQIMSSGNSARIAGKLALGNQVSTNSSACNTGTEAVVQACHRIRDGLAKRMLAGGSEGHSHYIWAGFDAMRVLNRNSNDDPEAASRPMSASAAGFIPGSGAGMLMLEESGDRPGAGSPHLRGGGRRLSQLRRPPPGGQHDRPQPEQRRALSARRPGDVGARPPARSGRSTATSPRPSPTRTRSGTGPGRCASTPPTCPTFTRPSR